LEFPVSAARPSLYARETPAIRNIVLGMVVREGCVLVEDGYDALRDLRSFRALEGGIEFGELAEAALRREFRELGCELEGASLLGVPERPLYPERLAEGRPALAAGAETTYELRHPPA
jgi:hypothetical protein